MARRRSASRRSLLPKGVCAFGTAFFALLTLACAALTFDVSSTAVEHTAAAQGRAGEVGTVTVTGERRVASGRGASRVQCLGTFTPKGDGPARTDVDVHVPEAECVQGRSQDARFVEGDDFLIETRMSAYVPGATPAGRFYTLAAPLLLIDGVFGLFGLACAVFTFGFAREFVRAALMRPGRRPEVS
ncbi:hypothetical protein [Nocardiopsis baichengensis]|uniref:hypothetical protein n=1 Tax=Nocardiopsis baichengensis TaxID=280240 RepID=UPI000346F9DD|nr:hypothetical protein [Nocardiopsis baichengensis]